MAFKILFVDDEPEILVSYKRVLRKQFEIYTATSGAEGLTVLKEQGPFAVIVSDMRMPKMNGAKFLKHAYEQYPDTVRILLTGKSDLEDTISAINEGHIFRFLSKPCPPTELSSFLQEGIKHYKLIKSEKVLLEKTLRGTIKLLTDILALVKPEEFSRTTRLKKMSMELITKVNPKFAWKMEITALLAHIGLMTIPSDIIRRKNKGELLDQHDESMFKKHAEIAFQLISNIPRMGEIAEAIRFQEKYFDGRGVPDEKRVGHEIPLMSRVLKIVHDFDRLYINGTSLEKAYEKLSKSQGIYDIELLDLFRETITENTVSNKIVKYIQVNELEVGMILAEDVKIRSGSTLLTKGHEITDLIRIKLIKFVEMGHITNKLKVELSK